MNQRPPFNARGGRGNPRVGWALWLVCLGIIEGGAGCQGQVQGGAGEAAGGGGNTPAGTGSGAGAMTGRGGIGASVGVGLGGSPGNGGSAGSTQVGADCNVAHAAPVRFRLLSSSQYDNSVLDLLQVGGNPALNFGDKVFEQLDDTRVEQRANAAAQVAQQAALTLAKWSPCAPPATGDATACEQQIIDKIGSSAYRHPLGTDERTQLKALFDAGLKEKDFATGVEWFLTGILQSPDFMYEVVKPAPTEVIGQVRPLAPHEYASRLAYFLWDSLPDDKLMAAAAAEELSDVAKRQVHLTRMIQDPRFMRGVERFYTRWLNIPAFHEVARDADGFTEDIVTALSTSLLMSATQLYSAAAPPNFSSLFSGDRYYLNDGLRNFYGVAGTGTAFVATAMTGQSRRGIVTHPALMTLLARPKESFPIARGLFVLRTLLCKDVPPPTGLTIPELPPIQDGLSTRDRLEAHATVALCATCHSKFDSLGFALESFDEVGRFRTVDHGKAVDTSGQVSVGGDIDGVFAKGDDLLAKMTDSPDVRSCFAQQYLKFALSTQEIDPADTCSVNALGKAFAPSGDLKQLVVAIVGSDAFRLRLAEGVAK